MAVAPEGASSERGASARRVVLVPKERVERDEEDLVRLYLTDIGQYPLLTKEDEVRLAQEIEAGNDARGGLECTAARSSTGARASSFRRTPRGGSVRRSPGASPTPVVRSGCLCTRATPSPG